MTMVSYERIPDVGKYLGHALDIRRTGRAGFDLPMSLWISAYHHDGGYREVESVMRLLINADNFQGVLRDQLVLQIHEDELNGLLGKGL